MILISPYAKALRNGRKKHPKEYPYWRELIDLLPDDVVQVGIKGERQLVPDFRTDLSMDELGKLVDQCDTWISVDSFFQHFAWDRGKYGIVLWGQSDPIIFGHPENTNLLKDRKYLRERQFWLWEQCDYRTDCWVSPQEILQVINNHRIGESNEQTSIQTRVDRLLPA